MPDTRNHFTAMAHIRGIGVVFGRELGAFFDAPVAYVYAAVFLTLSCSIYMNAFFLNGVLEMRSYFDVLPYLLIAFIPAMTMRIWAEERAQHTFELLMTLPLLTGQIVLGKFLSALTFYAIVLAGTLPIAIMLVSLGDPDLGLIVSNYLGAIAMGGFFISFGMFASGLTRDQIVAYVLAALLGSVFVLCANDQVVEVLDGLAPRWQMGTFLYESLSVGPRQTQFSRGAIGLSAVLYYGLMTGFFLWMNTLSLKRSRF